MIQTLSQTELGDYTLIKPIGQGVLGQVYLAEHRFMKRQYVVKILPEELASDRGFVQRFQEEVGALSKLEHPHLVAIHNVSSAPGKYFLVTDCVVDELGETTNASQYLAAYQGQIPEEELITILTQVAGALDYAHSKSIDGEPMVHRGLKPSNILISRDHSSVHASVSDFGLTKMVGTGAVLTRTLRVVAEAYAIEDALAGKYPSPQLDTRKLSPLHHSFWQTFNCMAPEQKQLGADQPVGPAADVYAFGALTYYLLTGKYAQGIFEPPSQCVPDYTKHWDELIQQCLQQDPQKRPQQLEPLMHDVAHRLPSGARAVPIEQYVAEEKPEPEEEPMPLLKGIQVERPEYDPDPLASLQVDPSVKQYHPEHKDVENVEPILTDMIVVTGGEFARGSEEGSRDEMPRHKVRLNAFALDIHPVTNEQFVLFLQYMGGEKEGMNNDVIRLRESRIRRSAGKLSIESGYAKHPVVGVTWYGAVAYAKWVGKRLPTEAEWEIASKAGSEGVYPSGDEIEKTQANFFSSDSTAVMSYAPNEYGLYDMAGNVYEWCQDWYGYNYYEVSAQEPDNPKGPLQGVYRVLRGGCWKSLKEDLRCGHRHRNNPGTFNRTYGFRCATDVK